MDSCLAMISMCQATELKHLPMAGGMYDQHPVFIQRLFYVLEEQEKQRKKEENERKHRESGPRSRKMSSRGHY